MTLTTSNNVYVLAFWGLLYLNSL